MSRELPTEPDAATRPNRAVALLLAAATIALLLWIALTADPAVEPTDTISETPKVAVTGARPTPPPLTGVLETVTCPLGRTSGADTGPPLPLPTVASGCGNASSRD